MIVGPIRSRKNTGIVVVNSQGAVTSIPTYDADAEGVAQTRDGLEAAAVFVPIIAAETEDSPQTPFAAGLDDNPYYRG